MLAPPLLTVALAIFCGAMPGRVMFAKKKASLARTDLNVAVSGARRAVHVFSK